MKSLFRIALILFAIAVTALVGFTGISSPQAFTDCDAPIYQNPPPGFVFKSFISCDTLDYELWENTGTGAHIRRPAT